MFSCEVSGFGQDLAPPRISWVRESLILFPMKALASPLDVPRCAETPQSTSGLKTMQK